ncbi:MAG: hypothetical protein HDT39_04735 [Lachnospiraceae bacterium]|nr:hypothetical protein [Lachnospiraceae bacterium]
MTKEYFGPESLDELSRLITKDIKNSSSNGDGGGSSEPSESGKDGFSPVVKVTEIEGGHKVGITDADGEKTFDVMNGKDGTNGQDGADGFSPIIQSTAIDGGYQLTINNRDNSTSIDILNGKDGVNGRDGKDGADGQQGPQGIQGEKGEPFSIAKVYSSVEAMNSDFSNENVKEGQFVVIDTGDVNDEDNAKLFVKGETKYFFITDLSGAQGIQGPQGTQGIQGVEGKPGENGSDGRDGADGKDGVSPIVTITEIDGGHRVSIADATGTKSFDVMDGASSSSPSNPSSHELINAPIGAIMGWHGTEDTIPEGWHICDGENGTYDLRGKFMLGADLRKDAEGNTVHPVGETGGSEEVTLTVEQMPSHSHTILAQQEGTGSPMALMMGKKAAGTSSFNAVVNGSSEPHPNMPPFFSLIFIQKVGITPTDYVTEERMDEKIEEAIKNSNSNANLSNEIYSTTETKIGTWIDGKPLYRRVLSLTTPSVQNQVGYYQIPGLDSDQFLAIKYDGFVQANDHSRNPIISYVPSSQNFSIVWHDTNNGIGMMVANQLVSKQAYLIIEYTKSTDEPMITIGT